MNPPRCSGSSKPGLACGTASWWLAIGFLGLGCSPAISETVREPSPAPSARRPSTSAAEVAGSAQAETAPRASITPAPGRDWGSPERAARFAHRRLLVQEARQLTEKPVPELLAALGRYLAALAVPRGPGPVNGEDRAFAADEGVRRVAAYETVGVLRRAGALDTAFAESLLEQAGVRGFLDLAHGTPLLMARERWINLAAASPAQKDELPFWVQAQIEAAELLIAKGGLDRSLAARWLLERAGKPELARLKIPPQLQVEKVLGRTSVEGLAFPLVDTDGCSGIAESVLGRPHLGQCFPLSLNSEVSGEYLLVAEPAMWTLRGPEGPRREAYVRDEDAAGRVLSFTLIAFRRTEAEQLIVEVRSEPKELSLPHNENCQEPVASLASTEEVQSVAPMANYTSVESAAWLDQGRRLLTISPKAIEMYAGGYGRFDGAWIAAFEGSSFRELGCFHSSASGSYAADWHLDGSRGRQEFSISWNIAVQPSTSPRPPLLFRLNVSPSAQQRARFNDVTGLYELDGAPPRSDKK